MNRKNGARFILGLVFLLLAGTPGTAQIPTSWSDWARVRNLPVGEKVIVISTTGAAREYLMAFADESQVVLARPLKRVSDRVIDAMRGVGPNWPAVLGSRVVTKGGVRISRGGIQEDGTNVAAIEVLARPDVLEVRRPSSGVTSALLDAAAFGAFVVASRNNDYEEELRRRAGNAAAPPTVFPPKLGATERVVNPRDLIYRAPAGG